MYNELKYVINVANYNSLYYNILTVPFLLLPLFWWQNDKAFHALGGPTFFSKSQASQHLIPPEGVVGEWTGVRIIVYAQTGLKYSQSDDLMQRSSHT